MAVLTEAIWEKVQENWLGNVDAYPGNQYCLAAFGFYQWQTIPKGQFWSAKSQKQILSRMGFAVIWLIQMVAPPLIFFSAVSFVEMKGWPQSEHIKQWSYTDGTPFKKLLACLFIFGFILNGIFVTLDENNNWKRLDQIFTFFQSENPDVHIVGEYYLYLGAITNCWVVAWCCLNMLVVIGQSDNATDVVFDSLGLIFLFNLDDIGGDLGFIYEGDWPAERLAWVRDRIKNVQEEADFDCLSRSTLNVYSVTLKFLYFLLIALPLFNALTDWNQFKLDGGDKRRNM